MVRTQGRGGASQSEAGRRPTSIQGETEGAKNKEEWREENGSDDSNNGKDWDKDEESKSTSSEQLETEEPSKPPTGNQAPSKASQEDANEGKEEQLTMTRMMKTNFSYVMWMHISRDAGKVDAPGRDPLRNVV